MDGHVIRPWLRRLARAFGAAAEWCYRRSHPRWHWTALGLFHYGRRVGAPSPPWKVIIKADPCAYCGQPSETVDHIVPRAAGGPYGWPNETGACRACNAAKGAQPMLAFLHQRHAAARAREREDAQRRAVRLTRRQRWEQQTAWKNATRPRPHGRGLQSGGHR